MSKNSSKQIPEEFLEKWRTGLYAANPENCQRLVKEIDNLRDKIRKLESKG